MKSIVFILLLAGLGLLAPFCLYGQSDFERSKKDYENSALKKKMDSHAAKVNANDPFNRLSKSPRRTNRCTTKYLYTITVNTPGGNFTLYYGENETEEWRKDYNALTNAQSGYETVNRNPKIENPNYRGDNQANNDWQAHSSFSSNEIDKPEENLFDLPSARENAVTTNNSAIPEITLNFDNLGDYVPKNDIVIFDISGKSLLKGHLDNLPSLPGVDSALLAKSREMMKERMDITASATRARKKEELIAKINELKELFSIEQHWGGADLGGRTYMRAMGLKNQLEIDDLNNRIKRLEVEPAEIDEELRKRYPDEEKYKNNAPWQEMCESINNHLQLTTVVNQLVSLNSGEMPAYVGKSGDSYHFKDEKKGTLSLFFVDKDGSYMEMAKVKTLSIEMASTEVSIAGVVSAKMKPDGDLSSVKVTAASSNDGSKKVEGELSKDKAELILSSKAELEKKEMKNLELINIGMESKPMVSLETLKMKILDDGSALKFKSTLEAGKGELSGKIGIEGIEVKAGVELINGKGNFSYVQSPDIESEKANFKINQSEYGISLGGGLSVGGKAKLGKKDEKLGKKDELESSAINRQRGKKTSKLGEKGEVEGSAIVKVGVNWENYNTNENISYMSDETRKYVVQNFYYR